MIAVVPKIEGEDGVERLVRRGFVGGGHCERRKNLEERNLRNSTRSICAGSRLHREKDGVRKSYAYARKFTMSSDGSLRKKKFIAGLTDDSAGFWVPNPL